MKKTGKKDTLNLIFSAFLIVGYLICSYFFLTMGANTNFAIYIQLAVFTVFGLVLFYATRVGEGKQVVRFSPWTLIIVVLPALYAVVATLVPEVPLHNEIANLSTNPGDTLAYSPIFILACVALGYGLPYSFLSGYEIATEEAVKEVAEDETDAEKIEADTDAETFEQVEAEAEQTAVEADTETEQALTEE